MGSPLPCWLAIHMVRAEGDGAASYGKGMEGFQIIDPGKTLVIRFLLESKGAHLPLRSESANER